MLEFDKRSLNVENFSKNHFFSPPDMHTYVKFYVRAKWMIPQLISKYVTWKLLKVKVMSVYYHKLLSYKKHYAILNFAQMRCNCVNFVLLLSLNSYMVASLVTWIMDHVKATEEALLLHSWAKQGKWKDGSFFVMYQCHFMTYMVFCHRSGMN